SDAIESYLNVVQKFVQAAADDLSHLHVIQFGAEAAELLLSRIPEAARRSTRNGVERRLRFDEAVVDRAGKFPVKDEKLDDLIRRYLLKPFSVHLKRARGPENSRPHQIVVWTADGVE